MTATMDMVRMLISAQMLTTVFLAALLWALHVQLRRQEFNRWWVSAWTLSALFLVFGRLAMAIPRPFTIASETIVLLATLAGFLVSPTLAFGAISLRTPGKVTRRFALVGLGAAIACGALTFASSVLWVSDPFARFSVRNAPRSLALAVALFFCARVFYQRVRLTKSWAALMTGVCCLIYALNQCVYVAAEIAQVIGSATGTPRGTGRDLLLWSARFLISDVAMTCGICFGMVLLLVEEYQRSTRELVESTEENTALQLEIRRRREAEEQLRASEDRYRDLVENSEDLVCTHDLDGRLLSCNPAPARILGYKVEDLLKIPARELLAPDVRNGFDEYIKTVKRDGVAEGIVKVTTRQGERRLWAFRSTLRTDGVATPIVRGMARDVTHQYRAEQQVRELREELSHASRVTTLSALTGSLAHEINQPLTAIRTNAFVALKMLDMDVPNVDAIRDSLTDIVSDDQRIGQVIQRLRGLLRKDSRDYAPVDVNAIVNDVLTLTRSSLIERRIALEVVLEPGLSVVLGDRVQLQQVVLNLLMNAADAVSGAENAEDRAIVVTTGMLDAQVRVSVIDRGVGVSNAVLSHMFDPFFTTKADGMGLGLSICREIIDAHDGQIAATRNADRGLTCTFVLDAVAPATRFATAPADVFHAMNARTLAAERRNG